MTMPGWYDIINFDSINRSEDERGITRSRLYLHSLINQELDAGVPAKRIVLGGFSQGGAMSRFSGLSFTQRLAGVFGLSCYQLVEKKFDELRKEAGDHKPPVFMGHGKEDPLVKLEYGQMTAEGLKKRGFNVDWREYEDTAHSVSMDEFDELEQWVQARLNENE
jgi:predicted esterase